MRRVPLASALVVSGALAVASVASLLGACGDTTPMLRFEPLDATAFPPPLVPPDAAPATLAEAAPFDAVSATAADAPSDSPSEVGSGCEDDAAASTPAPGAWPSPPACATAPPATSTAFAIHHLHLGDELDATGNPDWYLYGYDLDGKITAAASTDVCSLATGAGSFEQVDGPDGLDNSFGAHFLPILSAVSANESATSDTAIASGVYGWLLAIQGLSADPAQSSSGLLAQFFLGASFGQTPNLAGALPTFTTADDWPLDPSFVTSPVGASGLLTPPVTSRYSFPDAYVTAGELVTGAPAPLEIVLVFAGARLTLPLQHAVITFHHDPATQGAGGVIAGVIATQDLVSAIQSIAGSIAPTLCGASAFAQLAAQIEETADIMTDGTNVAGVPCDGISVGIGFDADEIGPLGYAGLPSAPPAKACSP